MDTLDVMDTLEKYPGPGPGVVGPLVGAEFDAIQVAHTGRGGWHGASLDPEHATHADASFADASAMSRARVAIQSSA